MERRLAAILTADVVGYSRLMGEDETATLAALKAHRANLIDPKANQYNGRTIKLMGDGILMEFPSVVEAVAFAVEVQLATGLLNSDLPEDRQIHYRIGINIGDIIVEGDDIYGDGVNIAARLESLAEPGGICVRRNVRNEVRDKLDLDYEDLGEIKVKNIARPIRTFSVVLDNKAKALVTPVEPARAGPAPSPSAAAGWRIPAVAVGIVILAAIGGLMVWDTYLRPDQEVTTPANTPASVLTDRVSIAVLPFANMSNDPEQGYFADGITEDLITDLSKFSSLFVVSRGAAFRYKGKDVSPSQVGRELGIEYVLEGSVRKVGAKVRINAQLIEAASNGHIWAERYDRDLEGIFTLQDEIAEKIAGALKVSATADEQQRVEQKDTDNLEAYDSFLRGRALYWRFTAETNLQSRHYLERAIELDPKYAAAYAELAHTRFQEWYFQYSKDPEALDRGLEAAQMAADLDDTSTLAYAMLGWIYNWQGQHDNAVAALKRAILIDPNNANAHYYIAEAMMWAGKPKELARFTKEAMRIDPLYPFYYAMGLGMSHGMLREYEEAIAVFKGILASKPDYLPGHIRLAIIYGESGRTEEARAEVAEILRLNPSASIQGLAQRLPYKDPALKERDLSALRSAGLPEKSSMTTP